MSRFVNVASLVFIALAGCTGKPTLTSSPTVTVTQGTELPLPERADMHTQNRPYLIGPFDKLKIDVFGIEEMSNREVQIDAGGRASFPLAGELEAAGKTPAGLAELIWQRLRGRYIPYPQVTVNLIETVSQVVTVDGQVEDPGLYPVVGS